MGLNDFLKKLFGNKSQRDIKEIEPYIKKIKAISPELEGLSNDELRARIDAVKGKLREKVAADRERIAVLKAEIENTDYDKRAPMWNEVDKLEKDILKKFEDGLDEVLPEVFAVVKETARRFASNETVVVTANDFDRDLAASHDFVHIDGDKAVYQNHWMAGGNETVKCCIRLSPGRFFRFNRDTDTLLNDLIGDQICLAAWIRRICTVSKLLFYRAGKFLCHGILAVYDEHTLHRGTECSDPL